MGPEDPCEGLKPIVSRGWGALPGFFFELKAEKCISWHFGA